MSKRIFRFLLTTGMIVGLFPAGLSALPPQNLLHFRHVLTLGGHALEHAPDRLVCETLQIRCQPFHLSYTSRVLPNLFVHVGSKDGLGTGGIIFRTPWTFSGSFHLRPQGISIGIGYTFPQRWGLSLQGTGLYGTLNYQDGSMLSRGTTWNAEMLISKIFRRWPLALYAGVGVFQYDVTLDVGELRDRVFFWEGGLACVR